MAAVNPLEEREMEADEEKITKEEFRQKLLELSEDNENVANHSPSYYGFMYNPDQMAYDHLVIKAFTTEGALSAIIEYFERIGKSKLFGYEFHANKCNKILSKSFEEYINKCIDELHTNKKNFYLYVKHKPVKLTAPRSIATKSTKKR